MKTLIKMLVTLLATGILAVWYLSDHPRPLSNADSIFVLVAAITSVLLAVLVLKIDLLQQELEEKRLIRKFISWILSHNTRTLQLMVDRAMQEKASSVDFAVQKSILFQKGGLAALGLAESGGDHDREQLFNETKSLIEIETVAKKDLFWQYYDMVERIGWVFGVKVRTPRSYKIYLPDSQN